jgi:hypothetical protein
MELLDMLEDPEIEEQVVLDTLEGIDFELELKADGYAKVIKELEGSIETIKAEQTRLAKKKSTMEANIARLKNNLQDAMVKTGKTKFKTDLFSFNIQKNGGKAPVILDVKDTSELPDELVRIKEEPDIEAIRKLIDAGKCKYAHYGERGESLRIK